MRDLVMAYYFVLRAALGSRSELRPCLTRCRHCGIFFLTHPRNRGRKDLGCLFGCRTEHRRQSSSERSTSYYRTPAGKVKKAQLNGKRPKAGGAQIQREAAGAGTECEQTRSAQTESEKFDRPESAPPPAPQSHRPVTVPGLVRGAPQVHDLPPWKPRQDTTKWEQIRSAQPESERIEFDAEIVDHVQLVTSLIEGFEVSREEIVAMLRKTVRQRRIVREKHIDYVLRRLAEHPP